VRFPIPPKKKLNPELTARVVEYIGKEPDRRVVTIANIAKAVGVLADDQYSRRYAIPSILKRMGAKKTERREKGSNDRLWDLRPQKVHPLKTKAEQVRGAGKILHLLPPSATSNEWNITEVRRMLRAAAVQLLRVTAGEECGVAYQPRRVKGAIEALVALTSNTDAILAFGAITAGDEEKGAASTQPLDLLTDAGIARAVDALRDIPVEMLKAASE